MTRRTHHPPRRYRPKPARTWEHYRHRVDDGERDLLARAPGLWLSDRQEDQ